MDPDPDPDCPLKLEPGPVNIYRIRNPAFLPFFTFIPPSLSQTPLPHQVPLPYLPPFLLPPPPPQMRTILAPRTGFYEIS